MPRWVPGWDPPWHSQAPTPRTGESKAWFAVWTDYVKYSSNYFIQHKPIPLHCHTHTAEKMQPLSNTSPAFLSTTCSIL